MHRITSFFNNQVLFYLHKDCYNIYENYISFANTAISSVRNSKLQRGIYGKI